MGALVGTLVGVCLTASVLVVGGSLPVQAVRLQVVNGNGAVQWVTGCALNAPQGVEEGVAITFRHNAGTMPAQCRHSKVATLQ